MVDLLRAAPSVLRERRYKPEPKPYLPRRWKSEVWVGASETGGVAIALPAPNLDLAELERRIGGLTGWAIRSGRGRGGVRPEVLFVLMPADEPVQLDIVRVGRKPTIEVVRVSGVTPVKRKAALKTFRQEVRISIHWTAPGEGGP